MTTPTALAKQAPPASIEYRPTIDSLRAIAVLAVFVFHLDRQRLPGGFVGVDIFFVISGYLITSIIYHDCELDRFSFARFYQRRISRLLPSFFVVALATVIAALFFYTQLDFASTGATLAAAAASAANLKFILQGNYFVISPDAQPFLHCWSLSVEEQFYLVFPAIFLVIHSKVKKHSFNILMSLCAISFLSCIVLTHLQPNWAFYLLPTRAWELLAGSLLAGFNSKPLASKRRFRFLPIVGLVIIFVSFFAISEHQAFPGYFAMLPVVGTVCVLFPFETAASPEVRFLSWPPLVFIGRMSYSLYLWHWPIFSLVDYRFYSASTPLRLALKVFLSFGATVFSFEFLERPARKFLNRPGQRKLAYAALICSLVTLVPLGLFVRNANYVGASMRNVNAGGLHFNDSAHKGSIILMGDSTASMYGTMVKSLAKELGLKLTVISVDGGDPLPYSSGNLPPLWLKSLEIVRQQKPDFLVISCLWTVKLQRDRDRLNIALNQLRPSAKFVFVITEPPILPNRASRQGIENGNRPPFFEDANQRAERADVNGVVKQAQKDNVVVINIEPIFQDRNGAIPFTDSRGRQLYQNSDHLSGVGANLLKAELLRAIIHSGTQ
jgi:peptidoglycan/LPS O-acetylase OafA/YrhL